MAKQRSKTEERLEHLFDFFCWYALKLNALKSKPIDPVIQLNLEYHVLVTREFLVEHQSQKNKIDLNQSFYNQKSTQP